MIHHYLIRYILVGFFLLVFAYTFIFQKNTWVRAWKKVFYIFVLLMACNAVIFPDFVTWVAQKVGVGRGADLVLYVMSALLIAALMQIYVKIRSLECRIGILAQHIALLNSNLANKQKADKNEKELE